jgi:hypothetical protein
MDDNMVKIVNKNMNLKAFLLIQLKDKLLNHHHQQQQQMMMMMLIYLVMKMKNKLNKQNNV